MFDIRDVLHESLKNCPVNIRVQGIRVQYFELWLMPTAMCVVESAILTQKGIMCIVFCWLVDSFKA